MKPETEERWTRLKELFREASELAPEQRAELLDRACAGAPELRADIEALLAADEEDDFLRPTTDLGPATRARDDEPDAAGALAGARVDRWRVLHRIGQGGMGEVYLAERADADFEQKVALKVLKRGLETEAIQRRFAVERRVLAALDHPHVARLLDAGALRDGRPYLVMEHVEGVPIDRYCDERRLPVRERLRLYLQVCDAVRFAHAQLVVHRDLKPANVLVGADGRVKLLDFGIAKLLEDDAPGLTATGGWDRPMTIEYASPEQVEGGHTTTASDVYSLGVLLYELLTGHPPFVAETRRELEHSVLEREPLRPSTAVTRPFVLPAGSRRGTTVTPLEVSRSRSDRPRGLERALRGDLDTIVLAALRKEPEHRYASVDLLAQDVRRYLEGLPVLSRRPTPAYRAAKFVRRNKALTAAGAALFLALVGGVTGTTWKAIEAERARDDALRSQSATAAALARVELERSVAEEVTRFLRELFESARPGEGDRDVTVREVMVRSADRLDATFAGRPEVRAAVRLTLASSFLALGELDRASAQAEAAVREHAELYGARDDRLAGALILQGSVRYARGELTAAAEPLERALAIVAAEEPPDAERVALIRNNLGAVRRALGDHAEAERLFRAALEQREERFGRASLAVAESLNNLSGAVRLQGRVDEAEGYLRESLAIRRAQLPADHPLVTQSVSNLAVLFAAQDKFAEAEPLLRESIATSREVLGPDHPDLAADLSNLANALRNLGRLEEAEDPLLECLDIRSRVVPGTTLLVLTELQYGRLLVDLGRLDEAEELLVSIAPAIGTFGPSRTDYGAQLLEALVDLYRRRGDAARTAHYAGLLEQRLGETSRR